MFPDASGWLVSTIDDYWTFASMLLAGGPGEEADPRTGDGCPDDHRSAFTPAQRTGAEIFLGPGQGWGLGL